MPLLTGLDRTAAADPWTGPTTGPAAVPGKQIALVTNDLRNDGVLGTIGGIKEAAAVLGWQVSILDGSGDAQRLTDAMHQAFAGQSDGVVLLAMDAVSSAPDYADAARTRQIPVVGWHVGPQPGLVSGTPVAVNVATDRRDVANLAAQAAIDQSGEAAGVVILTDYNYAIAVSKARTMADRIHRCEHCDLLQIFDLPLSNTAAMMPAMIQDVLHWYGSHLNYVLAINDLYFDDAVPTLQQLGIEPGQLRLISAGDGSPSAFDRIRRGLYQTATVAEPLNLQGWLLLDELNRLFAHQPVSDFVPPPHLFTRDNIDSEGGGDDHYDPDNGYRAIYRSIWHR